jgi:hypothetical protein
MTIYVLLSERFISLKHHSERKFVLSPVLTGNTVEYVVACDGIAAASNEKLLLPTTNICASG